MVASDDQFFAVVKTTWQLNIVKQGRAKKPPAGGRWLREELADDLGLSGFSCDR